MRSSALRARLARVLAPAALVASLASCSGGEEPIGQNVAATVVCAKGTTTPGLDVSYYQGTIDWNAVAGGGYQFAIVRIGDGTYEDSQFQANWSGSKAAGLVRGAYQFFRPGTDPGTQADIVVSKVGTLAADDLPVVCDVEATDGQSAATIVANLHVWVDKVQAGTGKKPIIYTGKYFWNDNVGSSDFASLPLWIAAYGPTCPDLPDAWSDWAMFQYTDAGSVPGISGGVDLDKFNGTLADLKALAQSSSTCSPEVCNGKDDDCDGVIDNGDVCEHDALLRDVASYAPPCTTDVDGDGKADVCGRGSAGFWCHRSQGDSWAAHGDVLTLSNANSWDSPKYYATLRMGDVDGDGKADVCGRGADGMHCWSSTGNGFGADLGGPGLSDASGWDAIQYYSTLRLADVDGDGMDDLCALAAKGLVCWPSNGHGFGAEIDGPAWSTASGFSVAKYYGTFRMGDVDGDGRADACIRTPSGFECWRSDGHGFPTKIAGPSLDDASGWGALEYWWTIRLADVNGDGKADVCARSSSALSCWFSTGSGFASAVDVAALSDASGWNDPANYRTLRTGDFDGDGKDDLCLRANAKMLCYRWNGAAFDEVDGPGWDDAVGWGAPQYFDTIRMGDVDGDGKADLCARAAAGWRCEKSTGGGFGGGEVALDEFTDPGGWGVEPYYPTLMFGGPLRAKAQPGGDAGPNPDGGVGNDGAPRSDLTSGSASGGCSCRVGTSRESSGVFAGVFALGLVLARRRRRS